jgi:preprotein translocase subunit SecE
MIAKIKEFVNDVSKEMKKVSWPSKEQLKESTMVVCVTTVIFTGFIYIVDLIFHALVNKLFFNLM